MRRGRDVKNRLEFLASTTGQTPPSRHSSSSAALHIYKKQPERDRSQNILPNTGNQHKSRFFITGKSEGVLQSKRSNTYDYIMLNRTHKSIQSKLISPDLFRHDFLNCINFFLLIIFSFISTPLIPHLRL